MRKGGPVTSVITWSTKDQDSFVCQVVAKTPRESLKAGVGGGLHQGQGRHPIVLNGLPINLAHLLGRDNWLHERDDKEREESRSITGWAADMKMAAVGPPFYLPLRLPSGFPGYLRNTVNGRDFPETRENILAGHTPQKRPIFSILRTRRTTDWDSGRPRPKVTAKYMSP